MAAITICSRTPKYVFLQIIHRDDQKGHENMLNIASIREMQTISGSISEMLPQSSQNGRH